jgi:hypothetical protein
MELAEQSFSLLSSNALPLWATIIAGVFVIISLSLSIYLLFNHLSAYKNPEVVNYLSMFELLELCLTWSFVFTRSQRACVLSGTEVSCRRHSHGALLCS